MRPLVAAFALAALVLTGCSGGPGANAPVGSPAITCNALPPEKCDEAVKSVARSLPNEHPVAIDISCVSGSCTLAVGQMDTVVTLAGGSQLRGSTLSWSDGSPIGEKGFPVKPGIPPPVVAPICQGVPVDQCNQMATGMEDPTHGAVVQIVVRCTKPPCTEKSGEGDTVITYGDGTTSTSGWGYSGS
jgi:streptogramin lyase